jgi:hypothetical protein
MKLARLTAAVVVCVTLSLAAASGASADPKAPGSESVTFVCDGVPITLTIIPGSAAFTASTSVGVGVGVVVTDVATGEELFSSLTPGFEHNVLETVTCTHTFDGVEVAVTAFFTPARP